MSNRLKLLHEHSECNFRILGVQFPPKIAQGNVCMTMNTIVKVASALPS